MFPVVRSSDARLSFTPFSSWVSSRRAEAKRSLLVQVADRTSAEDLFLYCKGNVGNVKKMHFYKNPSNNIFSVRHWKN